MCCRRAPCTPRAPTQQRNSHCTLSASADWTSVRAVRRQSGRRDLIFCADAWYFRGGAYNGDAKVSAESPAATPQPPPRCEQPPHLLTPVDAPDARLAGSAAPALSTRLPCRRCSSRPPSSDGAGAARRAVAESFFMRVKQVARGPSSPRRRKKMARAGGRAAVSCRAWVHVSMG